MQTIVKGYAAFHQGTGTDKKDKGKTFSYYQLCILERGEFVNLVKVKVPADKIAEASKADGQVVEVLCDMQETNYDGVKKLAFVFLKCKAVEVLKAAA